MRFSVIIPLAKKDTRYLRRALLSLQDQDYKDWEALVVSDGHTISPPIEADNISYSSVNSIKGAAYARNHGAKEAKGDILFFFDADCLLFPGMLRLISDRFNQYNPDFIYSGYRFNCDTLNMYPSHPFDPYLLESMNYISTMSPMKRKVFDTVGGFREELLYFQDWDFFIRAVKDFNYKGYYLRDIMFQTEIPNRLSISGKKDYGWAEKISKIEMLNNIKTRDICVTTLSAPYQAIERAKVLNARYIGMHSGTSLCQIPSQFNFNVKTVILQGFFPEAADSHIKVFPEKCLKVINWIGTDVWQLRNKFNYTNINFIKDNYLSKIDIQFCNSPRLKEELAELGIAAEVVYQPLTETVINSRPKRIAVSAYCSHKHPLHNEFFLKDLAGAMPDIDFIFFGTQLTNTQDGNIRYMGFVPIQEAIDLSTIHVRITTHDGFPHTPIYFAMAGRRVICNHKMEFCDYIEGQPNEHTWERMKPEIIKYIRKNLNVPIEYDIDKCRKYYMELCEPEKYKTIMLNRINSYESKA